MRCDAIWFDSIRFNSVRFDASAAKIWLCFCRIWIRVCCLCTVLLGIACRIRHDEIARCRVVCCMVCSLHCSFSMLNIQCSTFNWVSFLFIVYRLLCLPILGGSLSIFYYAFRVPYFRCFVALSSPPANSLWRFPIIFRFFSSHLSLFLVGASFSFVCRSSKAERTDIKRFNCIVS